MSKPSPYCECHKWDQPGGICAYCVGYTDGWTTETEALRRERDALAAERDQLKAHVLGMADRETWLEGRIERLTEALHEVVVLADVAPHEKADAHAIVKVADDALAAQAGKGVG